MTAVIIDGGVHIFLDWFLAFPLGMGMRGAAIATVTGTVLQVFIIGFGASMLDLGTVILALLMNQALYCGVGFATIPWYRRRVACYANFRIGCCHTCSMPYQKGGSLIKI